MNSPENDKEKHTILYNLSHGGDPTVEALRKSAQVRRQWMDFFYDNDPLVAAMTDIAKSSQMDDSEMMKFVICALALNRHREQEKGC